ncbi:MAG: phosphate ABC transporter permease PstA [Rhodobacteraceae bacterium]|nr:phosphate ABC transporter permease PstA [Paracoccaceae bacterium]
MTDASAPKYRRHSDSLLVNDAWTRSRNTAETRFRALGGAAISIGLIFLVILVTAILRNGLPAFTRTVVQVDFVLTDKQFKEAEKAVLKTAEYTRLFAEFVANKAKEYGVTAEATPASLERILGKVGGDIRSYYRARPDQLGESVEFNLATSSRVDAYVNGDIKRKGFTSSRFLETGDLDVIDGLVEAGIITDGIDTTFLFGADAGVDNPGGAGIGASVVGSLFMMIVVLVLALPISVAASIYLEEFAPKNRFTDLIEVSIANLAAVPSIVFGILGLAVFIQLMHLPQSAPLVGGLVLTLMTLPTIIIATRASLRAVPPSLRDAALGVGASKMQTVFHHVLPLAAPGILTGTIIGLAQALGETAPLLLIGMVGFVARGYPDSFIGGFTEANSAMSAQIYTWASRADPGFYEKAWGGIIILLIFLITMNTLAVILRRRFERRW